MQPLYRSNRQLARGPEVRSVSLEAVQPHEQLPARHRCSRLESATFGSAPAPPRRPGSRCTPRRPPARAGTDRRIPMLARWSHDRATLCGRLGRTFEHRGRELPGERGAGEGLGATVVRPTDGGAATTHSTTSPGSQNGWLTPTPAGDHRLLVFVHPHAARVRHELGDRGLGSSRGSGRCDVVAPGRGASGLRAGRGDSAMGQARNLVASSSEPTEALRRACW